MTWCRLPWKICLPSLLEKIRSRTFNKWSKNNCRRVYLLHCVSCDLCVHPCDLWTVVAECFELASSANVLMITLNVTKELPMRWSYYEAQYGYHMLWPNELQMTPFKTSWNNGKHMTVKVKKTKDYVVWSNQAISNTETFKLHSQNVKENVRSQLIGKVLQV